MAALRYALTTLCNVIANCCISLVVCIERMFKYNCSFLSCPLLLSLIVFLTKLVSDNAAMTSYTMSEMTDCERLEVNNMRRRIKNTEVELP